MPHHRHEVLRDLRSLAPLWGNFFVPNRPGGLLRVLPEGFPNFSNGSRNYLLASDGALQLLAQRRQQALRNPYLLFRNEGIP